MALEKCMQRRDAVEAATTAAACIVSAAQLHQLLTTSSSMTAPATTTTTFVTTSDTSPSVLAVSEMLANKGESNNKMSSQDMDILETTETETSLDTSAEVAPSDLGESREEEEEEDLESEESENSHNVTKEQVKDSAPEDKPLDYTQQMANRCPEKTQEVEVGTCGDVEEEVKSNAVTIEITSVDLEKVKKEIPDEVEMQQDADANANNNDDDNVKKKQSSSSASLRE